MHSGKDFAVSPFDKLRASPKMSKTRLCSHLFCLLEANDRRYLLPSQSCPPQVVARLRIPSSTRDNSSLRSEHSILQLPMAGKIGECSDFPLPILSTASGYKIEYPEFYLSKDPSTLLGMLNFVLRLRRTKLAAVTKRALSSITQIHTHSLGGSKIYGIIGEVEN